MLLTSLIDSAKNQYGDYPFLYAGDRTFTLSETEILSKKISILLRSHGICDGDRVMVNMPNCPEVIFSYQGILRARNIVVPVMFLLHPSEIHFILNDSQAKAIFTSALILPKIIAAVQDLSYKPIIIVVDEVPNKEAYSNYDIIELCKEVTKIDANQEQLLPASEEDVAVILYTSGTTGRPKGVMLSHRNLYSSAKTAYDTSNRGTLHSTSLGVLPLAHVFGFTVMNSAFLAGSSVVIFLKFDVDEVCAAIEKYKVRTFAAVPAMIHALVFSPATDKYDLSSLEYVSSGASALPISIIHAFRKKFNAEIKEGYGLSEAAPIVSSHAEGIEVRPGSVGVPIPGVEVRIIDENGKDVEVGSVGELLVKGDNVSPGYYQLEEITKKTIQEGWLYTGDLVKMDEDGYLYIVDRKNDLIIRGGFNIYPRDIEEIIAAHEAVSEVAVIGIPHEKFGEEIIACVVQKPNTVVSEEEIIALTQQKLAKYKTPKRVLFIDELPRNGVGKILKRKLREIYASANVTN